MAGNQRQEPAVGAAHPTASTAPAKGTSKYTNKDGSKFITVPKASSSTTDSTQPSPSLPPTDGMTATQSNPASSLSTAQPINRKKAKRRAKAAAKAMAEQALNQDTPSSPTNSAAPSHDRRSLDVEHDFSEPEDEQLTSQDQLRPQENGTHDEPVQSKKSKKKKKKALDSGGDHGHDNHTYHNDHVHHVHHHDLGHNHAPHHAVTHGSSGISNENIWNTSSQEERKRIKEFWMKLGEDERKSLVKVEKDAVLKKMKEQQKQACSCSVCGRKRTAIEEELEGLYDAYYQELEQFTHNPSRNGEGPPMMGSLEDSGVMANASRVSSSRGHPSRGRIIEHVGDNEDDEEEEDGDYSEEEPDEDDAYSEDEVSEDNHPEDYFDFKAFGKNLTVQGGILTVADDLLKDNGKKFIDMMEQLAERRMQREEDAKAFARNYSHTNGAAYEHNHAPPEEEEYDEEEEEEEYDEEDDEEYDSQEEEQDALNEQKRMDEGKRMFQIFAARMFEQRVLTAYREKVAKERQQMLIREIEEESRAEQQKKAKKAKEAQRRKDKAANKKKALAEKEARRGAEKAAEEAARLAEETRKAEEQRQKAEEKRKKKEAQKKAEEAERQRRIHEQKEKQAEQERKAREAKERDRKAKEEAARQKEKEAKERKEQEARERREQQEREKREKEAKARAEQEARDKLMQEQQKVLQKIQNDAQPVGQKPATALPPTATPITLPKRPAQHARPAAVPALPQQPALSATAVASPQITIATPALPKGPTTVRNRQPSQQQEATSTGGSQPTSLSESNTSQAASPHPLTPSHTSPSPVGLSGKARSASGQGGAQQQPAQTASPMAIAARAAMASQHGAFGVSPMLPYGQPLPGLPSNPPPGLASPLHHQAHVFPTQAFGASFGSPSMPTIGTNMNRPPPGGNRAFGYPPPPPGFNPPLEPQYPGIGQGFASGPLRDNVSFHHRQSSGGFEQSPSLASAQPISRPMPIQRPPSVAPVQRPAASLPTSSCWGVSDLESHRLGSSALLDNSEEASQEFGLHNRRNTSIAVSGVGFPGILGMDPAFITNSPWPRQPAAQPSQLPPPGFQHPLRPIPWSMPGQTSAGFPPQNGLGRQSQPSTMAIRQLMCEACKELSESPTTPLDERMEGGFVSLKAIKAWVDATSHVGSILEDQLLDICDTEGNHANGGGTFKLATLRDRKFVRWVPDSAGHDGHPPLQRAPGAPGEIGSPVVGSSTFSFSGTQRI